MVRDVQTLWTVRSKDGTAIAFERCGDGPGKILVGGALGSGVRNLPPFVELARLLHEARSRRVRGPRAPSATSIWPAQWSRAGCPSPVAQRCLGHVEELGSFVGSDPAPPKGLPVGGSTRLLLDQTTLPVHLSLVPSLGGFSADFRWVVGRPTLRAGPDPALAGVPVDRGDRGANEFSGRRPGDPLGVVAHAGMPGPEFATIRRPGRTLPRPPCRLTAAWSRPSRGSVCSRSRSHDRRRRGCARRPAPGSDRDPSCTSRRTDPSKASRTTRKPVRPCSRAFVASSLTTS